VVMALGALVSMCPPIQVAADAKLAKATAW